MLKGGKPGLQAVKGSAGSSSLPFPDHSHRCSQPPAPSGQLKSKLNLFTAASMLQQGGAKAATRPPEPFSGLANGSVPGLAAEGQQANTDASSDRDQGALQLQLRQPGTGQSQIYSVSEEVGEWDRDEARSVDGDRGAAMETAEPSSERRMNDERKDSQKDEEQTEGKEGAK